MNGGSQKKTFKKKVRRRLYRILTALNNFDFSRLRPVVFVLLFSCVALVLTKLPTTQTTDEGSLKSAAGHSAATAIRTTADAKSSAEYPVDIVALFVPEAEALSGQDTLYSFYLTGEELYYLAEGVAITAKQNAALYLDGLHMTYHKNRLPFGRVTSLTLQDDSVPVENALYHIVSTEDIFALFHYISYRSLGIMELHPKSASGEPLSDYQEILLTESGETLTVSSSVLLAGQSRQIAIEGTPSVVTVSGGFNLIELVRSPNRLTICIFALLFTLCVLLCYIVPRLRRIRLWIQVYLVRSKKRSTHTLTWKRRFRKI